MHCIKIAKMSHDKDQGITPSLYPWHLAQCLPHKRPQYMLAELTKESQKEHDLCDGLFQVKGEELVSSGFF